MKLIDKLVKITDKESIYCGEWGRVKDFDGEYYYIAIADDKTALPIFDRKQFKVIKNDFTK